MGLGTFLAFLGVALAAILPGIGSVFGINFAARAAGGVLAEDPDKFGSLFLYVVLPGTQGFYGFVIAFLILNAVKRLGGISVMQGWQLFAASLPIAVTGLLSAIYQGKVCVSGVNLVAKKPAHAMKGVIYAAMVETYAVLGLLISLFLIMAVK